MEELLNGTVQLSALDMAAIASTLVPFVYSLTLAVFRHMMYEDLGIFDTIADVFSFLLLVLLSLRNFASKEPDRSVCVKMISVFIVSHCFYLLEFIIFYRYDNSVRL